MNSINAELPQYISQKRVWALKIASIAPVPIDAVTVDAAHQLIPTDIGFAPIKVSTAWLDKHNPQPGWYWIRYQDGYESAAPADVFEAGNTLASDYGPPLAQEPKYTIGARGRLVKRDTGMPIPDAEPVMVFRAQDRKAPLALLAYLEACDNADHCAVVKSRLLDFEEFQRLHPERVKEPDSSTHDLARSNIGR